MAAQWHYSKDGRKAGPIPAQQLKAMADSGLLLPSDLIRKEGMVEWTQAGNVKGLFTIIPAVAVSATSLPSSTPANPSDIKPSDGPIKPRFNGIEVPPKELETVDGQKRDAIIYYLAFGAIAVALVIGLDFGRMSLSNILISLQYVMLQALLPVALVYRLLGTRTGYLTIPGKAMLIGAGSVIVIAFAIQVSTGYFTATFRWLGFLEMVCRISLAMLMFMYKPNGIMRSLLLIFALLFCVLGLYIAMRNGWQILSGFTGLTKDVWQLFRIILSVSERLMVISAVLWYCVRHLNLVESDSPEHNAIRTELGLRTGNFVEAAKGAAQYTARQAERTKLINLTLPPMYQALGRHVYSSSAFRAEFVELFQQLDQVQAELSEISGRSPAVAKSLGDKAKAMAGQAMQAAQSQKLSLRQSSLFGTLGKAVYDKHEAASGPVELVKPIADSVARLAMLDSDLDGLSASKDGSWITPKRLTISVGTAACVLLLIFMLMWRGGTASYTQRVLDLTAEQKKEFGVSVPKGARPLFSPGSAEDFMQSLTLFKSENQRIAIWDMNYGVSSMVKQVNEDNNIRYTYQIECLGGVFIKQKCWDMIYGMQQQLKSVNESTGRDRRFGGGGIVLMNHWTVPCRNETILVRGYSPKYVAYPRATKDEVHVRFLHFNTHYQSICPKDDDGGIRLFSFLDFYSDK